MMIASKIIPHWMRMAIGYVLFLLIQYSNVGADAARLRLKTKRNPRISRTTIGPLSLADQDLLSPLLPLAAVGRPPKLPNLILVHILIIWLIMKSLSFARVLRQIGDFHPLKIETISFERLCIPVPKVTRVSKMLFKLLEITLFLNNS
jgi:hypothetical protein